MIGLAKGLEPQVLTENKASWTADYIHWHSNRNGSAPRDYAHPDIRSTLRAETHAKCAYCEGRINDVAYDSIEHILPKSVHPSLVCTWDNLTTVCPRCNTNKGDYDSPSCPLLNPYQDDVEQALAFGGPLALPRGGPRSRATITRLDLNRMELLFARAQVLQKLDLLLDLVERATSQSAVTESLWLEIDALTEGSSEFASACRHFLASESAKRGLTRP